jgi:hypothetical protein
VKFAWMMYPGTKVCRGERIMSIWPWPCDLETSEDFWLIFGGRMYRGTTVCRAKESCRCDLWPWLCDLETEIPFRSASPKRMKIFGWYMVWGCIRRRRCVRQKICVDVTFDLDPVTMTPNCIIFPFLPIRLKIFGWYLVGGCIRGQRYVARKNRVYATFDLETEIPFHSFSWTNEDFRLIFGVRMYQGTKVCQAKDLSWCDLWPLPSDHDLKLHNISLPLYNSLTTEDFWLIFGVRMYRGTNLCRAKESCRYDLWPWLLWPSNWYSLPLCIA